MGSPPRSEMTPARPEKEAPGRLTRWLQSAPEPVFIAFAIAAAFSTYFSMYAFRKPFAAAQFAGERFAGLELKTAFVISQLAGYTLSKYIGIKVCSEITRARRALALVLLVLWAEAALVLFAVAPPGLKVTAIFLNGLPLGMIWGLVVWYLEGRRTSEILLAGLSSSYILASAVVKDAGTELVTGYGVSESWMPALTGLCFLPPFLVSVWLLDQIPKPTEADIAARVEREPMDHRQRVAFVRDFLPGMVLLMVAYFFLTAYRDFRDNYGAEIFAGLGYAGQAGIFTRADWIVMSVVMAFLALLNVIKNNRLGLLGAYAIMTAGAALLGVSTLLLNAGKIDGFWWMTSVGLGCYLAYVPFGSVLFDRLIASTGTAGTAVFAIYVADAIGYTGSVGVQLYKDLARAEFSRLEFFKGFTYFMSILGILFLAASCAYFMRKTGRSARKTS